MDDWPSDDEDLSSGTISLPENASINPSHLHFEETKSVSFGHTFNFYLKGSDEGGSEAAQVLKTFLQALPPVPEGKSLMLTVNDQSQDTQNEITEEIHENESSEAYGVFLPEDEEEATHEELKQNIFKDEESQCVHPAEEINKIETAENKEEGIAKETIEHSNSEDNFCEEELKKIQVTDDKNLQEKGEEDPTVQPTDGTTEPFFLPFLFAMPEITKGLTGNRHQRRSVNVEGLSKHFDIILDEVMKKLEPSISLEDINEDFNFKLIAKIKGMFKATGGSLKDLTSLRRKGAFKIKVGRNSLTLSAGLSMGMLEIFYDEFQLFYGSTVAASGDMKVTAGTNSFSIIVTLQNLGKDNYKINLNKFQIDQLDDLQIHFNPSENAGLQILLNWFLTAFNDIIKTVINANLVRGLKRKFKNIDPQKGLMDLANQFDE